MVVVVDVDVVVMDVEVVIVVEVAWLLLPWVLMWLLLLLWMVK